MRWNVIRPSPNRRHDAGKPGLGQHDAGGRFGDVGGGGNGDADLRLAQRRRIIGAVAAHADGMAGTLKRLDQAEFVFGQDAGENGKIVGPDPIGNRPGGQTAPARPTASATKAAVVAASPVTMTVWTPSARNSVDHRS